MYMGKKELAIDIIDEDWIFTIAPADLLIAKKPTEEIIETFLNTNMT
jgi:hypothetical protein